MSDIMKSILTDESVRDAGTVEQKLMQQGKAAPWFNALVD